LRWLFLSLRLRMSRSSHEIKKEFLDFFKSKGHQIVPSAPIVVKGDPTLMFTNAGMNQFKDFFLGNAKSPNPRIANSQKCLRVSGKHNDLEEVGHDHYHHTMFEMLGNWSFGDYFKKESLEWAWELLTEVYKLPKDRLYVSVFEGDAKEGLAFDQEAFDIWKSMVPESHIVRGNKKDNFWEMGDTGPCGPCSEIHMDMRSEEERAQQDGAILVNADHPEVIEIWNNVFMEFNRLADGSLQPLPDKHVDTGMGFERLVRVIQQKKSNYDTDIFRYIIEETSKIAKIPYGTSEKQDIAYRVIADHIRAVVMIIADGQLPSNTGAGYVARRVLRRAVRYGYSYLNLNQPFLCDVVPHLAAYFNTAFPEIAQQQEFIQKVVREEEASFFRTLSQGMNRLNEYFENHAGQAISGEMAFELYDTFGFPIDLTELIAREKSIQIDLEGFQKALKQQKERSKADAKKDLGDWQVILEHSEEAFCGYDTTNVKTQISRYRQVEQKGKKFTQLVLDNSPFYAESGGQVGDTGWLIGDDGAQMVIFDTQKENKLHILFTDGLIANPHQQFTAQVDAKRRQLISANHSVTHLMHSALKEVLGPHVAQKGSLVSDESLRFDFSHFGKMSEEEILKVEQRVNAKIRENIQRVEYRNMPIEEARKMGATALFGEKYGDFVRVIEFDAAFSLELCGGTHVQQTGDIGWFKLLSESSVSAGVRRIEALSSEGAMNYMQQKIQELAAVYEKFQNPSDLLQTIDKFIDQQHHLKKRVEQLEWLQLQAVFDELKSKFQHYNGVNFLAEIVELPNAEAAKQLCFDLKDTCSNAVIVLGYSAQEKPGIAIYIAENMIQEKSWNASTLVRECGKFIQGGGGGQPFFATAGGKDVNGLAEALTHAKVSLGFQ
jgi:alanyl-tRNA synthetase